MGENQNVGPEGTAGAPGQPSQSVSQTPQQPIEGDATRLLGALESKIDGLGKELRGLQSRQDKSETTFQQQLARFNQIKTQGNLSDEQAMAQMQSVDADTQWRTNLENMIKDLAGRVGSAGTQPNGQQAQVAKLFETVGLDLKDPRVASALLKTYDTSEAAELAAYRLAREITQSPQPNPAQNPSLNSGSAQAAANLDAVYQQYTEAFRNPTQNADLLAKLEKQMKDLGG